MCIHKPEVPPVVKKAFHQMVECIRDAGKPVADAAVEYVKSRFGKGKSHGKETKTDAQNY